MPYLIILAATLTALTESATLKTYNRRHESGGFIFMSLISLAATLFFTLKYLITDTAKADFTPEVIPYALLAGVFYCAASFLTFLSLKYGSFAISMLILSYSIVITSGYGIIFLKEPAGPLTYVAFGLILVSLFLVRAKNDKDENDGKEKKRVSAKWLVCIITSVISSGMYGVILREQQVQFNNTVTNECMIIAMAFSALTLFTIGIFTSKEKKILEIIKTSAPYALIAGTANGTTNMLSLTLHTMMPISVSAPTRSIVGTAANFTFSYFILKERFLPRQIIGVLLGAAAVVMLNLA